MTLEILLSLLCTSTAAPQHWDISWAPTPASSTDRCPGNQRSPREAAQEGPLCPVQGAEQAQGHGDRGLAAAGSACDRLLGEPVSGTGTAELEDLQDHPSVL